MAKSSAKKQANQQYANDMAAMQQQREWDLEDRDEAREYSRDVLKHLVTDAEEAGFNPLTVLRTGGGAGYNAAAGFAPLSRQVPSKQAVGGSPLGSAIQSAGQNFLANFDPFQDEKKELEFELVQAQIRNLNAGTAAYEKAPKAGSFAVPQYTATTAEKRTSGTAAVLSGAPMSMEESPPGFTNPWQSADINPKARNADAFEQRYGEPGGWFGGAWTAFRDLNHHISNSKFVTTKKVKQSKDLTWKDYIPSFGIKWD